MAVPTIDESGWPLVHVRWAGHVSGDDIDAHFDEMLAVVARGQRFGLVMSIAELDNPTAALRRRAADRLKASAAAAAGVIVCNGHVVASTTVRGILTAIYWLSPPPFPTKVFTDPKEAEGWVRSQLASAGLSV